MRRELVIILGVLVPFAVLVSVGWLWQSTPAPPFVQSRPPSTQTPTPVSPFDAGLLEEAVLVDRGPVPDAGLSYPPQLAVPLRVVEPLVRTCFVDEQQRAPDQVSVTVRFTPTRDGGFSGVSVSTSWQDPYLTACVEDVFAEMGWVPSGAEVFEPAQHTFRLLRTR
jgi:hypothetical protein